MFMFWAMVLLPGLQIATEAGGFQTLSGLAVYLMIAAFPMAQCFYIGLTIVTFFAEKIAASGNWPDPIGKRVLAYAGGLEFESNLPWFNRPGPRGNAM